MKYLRSYKASTETCKTKLKLENFSKEQQNTPKIDLNCRLEFPLKQEKLLASYKLRAKVFCRELKWVGTEKTKFEVDEFDKYSEHLGVATANGEIVGTLRFTSHHHLWLMEKYFGDLLPKGFSKMKLNNSVEVSRMAIENTYRSQSASCGNRVVELLYRGVYEYSHHRNIANVYIVVSTGILRQLKLNRLPVRTLCQPVIMEDGTETVAAVIDWNALYRSKNKKDMHFLATLQDATQCRNESPSQLPETDLLH